MIEENHAVSPLSPVSISSSAIPPKGFDSTPLFITLTAGLLIGAILGWPHLDYSPNDASRWNTIYSLVEHGTYEIRPDHGAGWPDHRIDPNTVAENKRAELIEVHGNYYPSIAHMPPFYTIDIVYKNGRYYSSKPPLLPTLLAGVVLMIEKVTGTDFRTHPRFIMRSTLVIAQAIPFVVFIWLMSRLILRSTALPFVQHFCIAATALGTYLTPWSVTLNNHVLAACSATVAVYVLIRIWYDGCREWYWFALAGFFASFTTTNEFPAAIFAAALMLAIFIKDSKKTVMWAVPFALVPIAASLLTNYIALGTLQPIYAEYGKVGGAYDYAGSYWPPRGKPTGIDALHEPWHVYMANIMVGHHGLFLLTPVFLMSLIGAIYQFRPSAGSRPLLAILAVVLTAATACFYTFYTTESKNYGGTAHGTRWLFWLIPLWLVLLPAGLELFARKWYGRGLSYVLLAVSLISVGCAVRQPWGASWAHLLLREWGWINY